VRAFFMTSIPDERVATLWEYEFTDPHDYESIRLISNSAFRIVEDPWTFDSFANISAVGRSSIIPQADDINKLLEFPFRVSEGTSNAKDIADHFGFDRRQSSYYREATEALGLVVLRHKTYEVTDKGKEYLRLPPDRRNQLFLRLVLELPIMNQVFLHVVQAGPQGVALGDIARIIKARSHLTGSTLGRRAQTVMAWYRWIETSLGLVHVYKGRIRLRDRSFF
jgi:hypothetical protein